MIPIAVAAGSEAAVQGGLEAQDMSSPEGQYSREEPPVILPTTGESTVALEFLHQHLYGLGQALVSLAPLTTLPMMHRVLGLIIPLGIA